MQADPYNGYWRLAVMLTEGTNNMTATAASLGAVSADSKPVILVLDTVPPPRPAILNTDGEAAPSRAHVIRGTADPGVLVEVYVNGTLGGSASAHYESGLWFIRVLLGAGDNSITARSLDGLGNPSAQSSAVLIPAPDAQLRTSIDNPPYPVSNAQDNDGTATLRGPHGVRAFESGGRAYAMVATASLGVQVIDFTNPRAPKPAGLIPDDETSRLEDPRDIEVFMAGGDRIAAVTSHRGGAVQLINVSDPLAHSFLGSPSYGDKGVNGTRAYPQLLGALDAAAFNATVNGTTGAYLIVVSDYGPTALDPGGFQILNVTEPMAPISVSWNHAVVRDENGRHVMARPPHTIPHASDTWALSLAGTGIIAAFDEDGDPVAETASVELPGYSRNFDIPTEGLYQGSWGWVLDDDTLVETRNSTGTVSVVDEWGPAALADPSDCTEASPCTGQNWLIVVNDNDTAVDKSDDYAMEMYRDNSRGPYSYPVAKLIGGKMLSVSGLDGSALPLKGADRNGVAFEALDGASSVDVFSAAGGTYAIVAASDSDGVQIIDVTDPTLPTAVAAARDGGLDGASRAFDMLDGAVGVRTASVGGGTYAVVAAEDDNGVQVIDVTNPAEPGAAASVADVPGSTGRGEFSMLAGAAGVDIFESNGGTYALVAAWDDNGFQVIDISDPSMPRAADRGHDGSMCSTPARYSSLAGALALDTLALGGRLYALVSANLDDALQIVDITDPERLVALGAVIDGRGGFSDLHEPIQTAAVEVDGRTYVLSASLSTRTATVADGGRTYEKLDGGGVQIIEVTDPSNPLPTAAMQHTDPQFKLLHGVRGIDTFVVGSRTYAIVTAEVPRGYSPSDGKGAFTIADISDPSRPRLVAGVRDGQPDVEGNRFDMLNAPAGVDTAMMGNKTYAIIAARGPWSATEADIYNGPHGAQIVDVSRPYSPRAVASIQDDTTDGFGGTYRELDRAHGVDIVQIGSGWYALVAAIRDDGVQVINITDPGSPRAAGSIDDSDANTRLDGANQIKAFERDGGKYAIVTAKESDALQVLNVTDPADPRPTDFAVDGDTHQNGRQFTELDNAFGVDTFELNGRTYAASTCGSNDPPCQGVQITDMSDPADMRPETDIYDSRTVDGKRASELRDPRGIATFTVGSSTYAAAAGFEADGVQLLRLASPAAGDTVSPTAVKIGFNRERGMLRITFDEPVSMSDSDIALDRIEIRNATGSGFAVTMRGASLAGSPPAGAVAVVTLTSAQRSAVAAFESPLLDFQAGAFEDLAGNAMNASRGVVPEIVTSRPALLGARLDLGTGEIALAFTEDVDPSGVDLSRIALYSPDAPQILYFPSGVVSIHDGAEITVRLGPAARQAVAGFADVPLLDVLDGAVNGSASGRPSTEYRGSPIGPVFDDRVDPVLVSAVLLNSTVLQLEFDEYVAVDATRFDVGQMYLRDGAGGNEVSLSGSTILTDRNGTHVLLRLNASQADAVAGYADPVLDMRLTAGGLSAVEDLSGQGIGTVRGFAIGAERDRTAPAFSARATAANEITVSFTMNVTGMATGPSATWMLGGPDAGALEVAGYPAVSNATSVVLTLSGDLPGTAPDVSLAYARPPGDIAAGNGIPLANSTVQVADGLAPKITSALLTGPNNATIRYTEPVAAPLSAYAGGLALSPGGPRTPAGISGNDTDTHVVTFGGAAAGQTATGTITINQTAVLDMALNPLGDNEGFPQPLSDGQPPSILSAKITGNSNATIRYNKNVTANMSSYLSIGIGGNTLAVSALDGGAGSRTHTLTFSASSAVPDDATGYVLINAASVASEAGAALGTGTRNRTLADGQAPQLLSARALSLSSINLVFSEDVVSSTTGGAGWSVSGGDAAGGLAVTGSSDISTASRNVSLAIGELPDTRPDGVTLSYARASGGIADAAGNALDDLSNRPVSDGVPPRIVSAAITGSNTITVVYSEPVRNTTQAAYAGLVLSPGGIRAPVLVSGSGTDTHTLTFDGDGAATNATGTLTLARLNLVDHAGSPLESGTPLEHPLADGQRPEIHSALITGDNNATIHYTEPVSAPLDAYTGLTLDPGGPRMITGISANATGAHVVVFDGSTATEGATATITINATAVLDRADPPNALGADMAQSQDIIDGRKLAIISAKITGPNKAAIQYSRDVTAQQADYAQLTVAGQSRNVTGLGGGGSTDTHTLTFDGAAAAANATGSVAIDAASVSDINGVPFGNAQITRELADGQAPSIAGVAAVSLTEIRVVFDEPVSSSLVGASGWSVSGGDAAGLAVNGSSDASNAAAALTLTLDGMLNDTRPDGVRLSYDGAGGIADAAGNRLGAAAEAVGDMIAPEIHSAAITGPNNATIRYTEPVGAPLAAYMGLTLDPGGPRNLTGISGNASDMHVVMFDGDPAASNAVGTITINATAVLDSAAEPNALGAEAALSRELSDGQAPAVASAKITGPSTATIRYSEDVAAQPGAYAQLAVAGLPRAVVELDGGDGTHTHTLTFDGDEAAANATGTLTMDQAMLADPAGNKLGPSAAFEQGLADGQRPEIHSVSITGDNNVTFHYTEPVGAPLAAYTGLALSPGGPRNLTGISGNATGMHVVAFDGDPAALNANGTITINATAVLDRADPPNALGTDMAQSWDVVDGRVLNVTSAEITGPNKATIQYSRDAMAEQADYTQLVVGGLARNVTALGGGNGTDTHTLAFDGAGAAPNATGSVTINAAAVADTNNVRLGTGLTNEKLSDGQAPSIAGVAAVSLTEIKVVLDEPVSSPRTGGAGWSVSGGDAAGLAVNGSSDASNATAALTLTLDGMLNDTRPDGVMLSYDGAGGIADAAGNRLGAAVEAVGDMIAPEIHSAAITGPNNATIRYTEPVGAPLAAYKGLTLVPGGPRNLTGISGNATGMHVVTFDGNPAASNANGTITINATAVLDTAVPPNALGAEAALNRTLSDGQSLYILSVRITGPNTATIRYSEDVAALQGAYTELIVGGQERNVTAVYGGNGTDTHTLTFDGVAAAPNATGSVSINATAVADSTGRALGTGQIDKELDDGQAPSIASAAAVSLTEIRVVLDELASSPRTGGAGWSVSGGDAAGLAVNGSSDASNAAATLTLTLDGELPDTRPDGVRLSYDGAGGIADAAGNRLGAAVEAVGDMIAPEIHSAAITGPSNATIRYTEPVGAPLAAYKGLTLVPGGPRNLTGISGNATGMHVVMFDGDPAALNANGTITINATAVLDTAVPPNALGAEAALNRTLSDGQGLYISSALITGPNTATIRYSEDAAAPQGAYAGLIVGGQERNVTAVDGGNGTDTHALAFDGAGAAANATGSVSINATAVADSTGRALGTGQIDKELDDGQAPSLIAAAAVSLTEVRAVFDEPVAASRTGGAAGWSASGGDAGEGIAVNGSKAVLTAMPTLALTLAADLPDTRPDGMTLSYDGRAAGGTADAAGNALGPSAAGVADGIPPAIASALLTANNSVTIRYSEPVAALPPAYASLTLAPGGSRAISGTAGNLTDAHTIAFNGTAAAPNATGLVVVNETAVLDTALPPNRLGDSAAISVTFSDGRAAAGPSAPPRAASAAASFTSPRTVTITYSGALGAPAGHEGPVYGNITAAAGGPNGTESVLVPTSEGGLGTAVHVVRLGGGAGIGAGHTGTMALLADLVWAAGPDAAEPAFANDTIAIAAGAAAGAIELPPLPPPAPGAAPPSQIVPIDAGGFVTAVDATAAGDAARPAINITGLAAGGRLSANASENSATFSGAAVSMIASFASVTFPPNVTAVSVPAHGLLVLHVSGAAPAAEDIAAALGYADAGALGLRAVVEIGDNGTHIAFDRPVRILLAGQSGGLPFYVNSTDGSIEPIRAACGADDTDAVHAQLGGAGECHLDSADGDDKVIHTYHLTLFGTARERAAAGPPAPVAVHALQGSGGAPVDGAAAYAVGDTIAIAVEFSAPVAVDARGGTPYLGMVTGSAGARAPYDSGNNTDTLEFAYVVRGGDVSGRVSYAGAAALELNGGAIYARGTGVRAIVALPEPGAAGSLSAGPPVRIDPVGRPVLDVGILDEAGPGGAVSASAELAAAEFNALQGRVPGALLVNASAYGAGATAESAAAAVRAAHASGAGPSVFVGPSTDRGLHAAMPYAAENGLVLASAGSTAPSLAVAGDAVFRMLPSGAQQAAAIATLVNDAGAESVVIVVDTSSYPGGTGGAFRHGLDGALSAERFASVRTIALDGPPPGWAAAARQLGGEAEAGNADAVVFLGTGGALAALADHISGLAGGLDRARWFASDAAANSPALLADPGAAAFAARARLAAVSYAAPDNEAARAVDGALSAAGAAAAATAPGVPYAARYAAHDAMAILARAANASAAGMEGATPSRVAQNVPAAAAKSDGALGRTLLDAAGDLWLPNAYDVWTVRAGQGGAPEWSVRQAAVRGIDTCSIRLGSPALDMRVNLNGYSTVASQTVINSGSQVFKSVQLQPTPWYIDPVGRPGPGHPALPASLAEVSQTGPRDPYAALTLRDTTVSHGLSPGGDDSLWFRVNLTGYTESPGRNLVQYVTYVAECVSAG